MKQFHPLKRIADTPVYGVQYTGGNVALVVKSVFNDQGYKKVSINTNTLQLTSDGFGADKDTLEVSVGDWIISESGRRFVMPNNEFNRTFIVAEDEDKVVPLGYKRIDLTTGKEING